MRDIFYESNKCDVVCDNKCGSTETLNTSHYSEISEELKAKGWQVEIIDDEMRELCCPRCKSEFKGEK